MKQGLIRKAAPLGLLFLGFFWANAARAVCPICVVAVGAGLGFSRWLGVDDVVSSIWIGAFLVAMIMWTMVGLKKKGWSFPYDTAVVSLVYYSLLFIPFYYVGIVGHPFNKIFSVDKIIFGTAIGTIVFLLSYQLHSYLKKKNGEKSFFQYQKIVLPVVVLILTSFIFYLSLTWKTI